MPIGIAFIRGINVGGKNMLPMAELRALCEGAGLKDARTHIQSGNLVFRCTDAVWGRTAGRLEGAIEKARGFRPSVVVRTADEVRRVLAARPFPEIEEPDPSRLLVMFLSAEADAAAKKAVAAIKADPERIVLRGREVFLFYPNGVGKSKLPFTAVEKALKVPGTCRNWNTVTKMAGMAGEMGNE